VASQRIAEVLATRILSGPLAPGTRIKQDVLAEELNTSRIPVREALKTLIGEGLVEHRQNFGYFVAKLTPEELQELYVVRGVLEAAALGAAVAHGEPEAQAADDG